MPRARLLLAGLLLAPASYASDHIDGPVTAAHRAADLSDLYAFPTPGRPGFLTIVLDTFPLAPPDARFSARVNETILLRRATLREPSDNDSFAVIETGDEAAIDCAFDPPDPDGGQLVTCASSNGLRARTRFGADEDLSGGFRLWAGLRADPFFLNTDFYEEATEGRLVPPEDDNTMRGANVLAIVLEVELARLLDGPPSLLAVAAETATRDTPGGPLRWLDRVGRPEITNVSLTPRGLTDLRDRYNVERTFGVGPEGRQLYRERLAANVAAYDALDGRSDWAESGRGALARLFADDFLLVDAARPCPPDSFLEIERALLRREAHVTCGGRRPEDDIVDTLFTLYVSGAVGSPVRDGVDRPAAPLARDFPYLAPPDLGAWSRLRVWIATKLLDLPEGK